MFFLYGNASSFEAAFSPDLDRAVYRSWRPLTDASNGANLTNLYLLDGLRDGPGTIELATEPFQPVPSLDPPEAELLLYGHSFAAASTDLSHLLLQSAVPLTEDAEPNFEQKLYLYADGELSLVGRVPEPGQTECDDDVPAQACLPAPSSQSGVKADVTGLNPNYAAEMLSDDGSRAFFQAPATPNGGGTIYMREDGHRTVQINVSEKDIPEEPPGTAELWSATPDGRYAFFTTDEGLVDGDDVGTDVYRFDADAPEGSRLTLITPGSLDGSGVIGAGADGRYLYFTSGAALLLWHDGAVRSIGSVVDASQARENTSKRLWTFPRATKTSRVSPDGRHLLFMARGDSGFAGRGGFAGSAQNDVCPRFYDSGGFPCRGLYLYSADTGALACVSCDPTGAPAASSALTDQSYSVGGVWITAHLSHALSDDGRRVFFSTAQPLVPEDTNGVSDAYLYEVAAGEARLLSSGTDPDPSFFLDAGLSGDDAFFVTRERLLGWDTDESYDLYDARVGGGMPEPVPLPDPCRGENCRSSASTPPATPSSGSGSEGTGNVKKRRCPKGKRQVRRKGKVRCVKKGSRRKPAGHDRRAGR